MVLIGFHPKKSQILFSRTPTPSRDVFRGRKVVPSETCRALSDVGRPVRKAPVRVDVLGVTGSQSPVYWVFWGRSERSSVTRLPDLIGFAKVLYSCLSLLTDGLRFRVAPN